MNILIACEESQRVCIAFREKGHNAFSCDILPCSGGHPDWHIQGDVLPILNGRCEFQTMDGNKHTIFDRWDMVIGFPPCTKISKAGARHMYLQKGVLNEKRYRESQIARKFFESILFCDCDCVCVENPTPLKVVGLPPPTQVIQPYYFGEPYSKRTLLWIRGSLPLLVPTFILDKYSPYIPSNTSNFSKGSRGSSGVARSSIERSLTFWGVARAMADQWG